MLSELALIFVITSEMVNLMRTTPYRAFTLGEMSDGGICSLDGTVINCEDPYFVQDMQTAKYCVSTVNGSSCDQALFAAASAIEMCESGEYYAEGCVDFLAELKNLLLVRSDMFTILPGKMCKSNSIATRVVCVDKPSLGDVVVPLDIDGVIEFANDGIDALLLTNTLRIASLSGMESLSVGEKDFEQDGTWNHAMNYTNTTWDVGDTLHVNTIMQTKELESDLFYIGDVGTMDATSIHSITNINVTGGTLETLGIVESGETLTVGTAFTISESEITSNVQWGRLLYQLDIDYDTPLVTGQPFTFLNTTIPITSVGALEGSNTMSRHHFVATDLYEIEQRVILNSVVIESSLSSSQDTIGDSFFRWQFTGMMHHFVEGDNLIIDASGWNTVLETPAAAIIHATLSLYEDIGVLTTTVV